MLISANAVVQKKRKCIVTNYFGLIQGKNYPITPRKIVFLTNDDIKACFDAGASVEEVLPDGSRFPLTETNYIQKEVLQNEPEDLQVTKKELFEDNDKEIIEDPPTVKESKKEVSDENVEDTKETEAANEVVETKEEEKIEEVKKESKQAKKSLLDQVIANKKNKKNR